MIVYRVQSNDGSGPYSMGVIPSYGNSHAPAPWKDGINRDFSDYIFGFATLAAFKRWFTAKQQKTLYANGQAIYAYRVSIKYVLIGKHQVAFNEEMAKRLDYVPYTKVFQKKVRTRRSA